ncbi:hypothetical protein [Parvularcula oceani]|uniref:hypothetical protein n=1 Tax=Parvularcula oceani TaxID=1247963 RepID=UPI0004E0F033|nr:hypothetical protein [Parvularcula oceani]
MQGLAIVLIRILAIWMITAGAFSAFGNILYTAVGAPERGWVYLLPPIIHLTVWLIAISVLLFGAPRIARLILPAGTEPAEPVHDQDLLKIGLLLLGLFLVVNGLADLARDVPSITTGWGRAVRDHGSTLQWNPSWIMTGPAAVKCIGGLFILRWASRR